MGCNQSTNPYPPPSASSYKVEEIRYQITFLPNHEIIGEFGQKIITNPLNNSSSSSSSSSSDIYKKEMKHNVYIKSIHPSVLTYCVDDHGMKVGDVIEKIRTDGPDGIEQDVIELNKTTNSLLTDERPITLTCSGKRCNDAMYWAWEKRKEYKKEFPKGTPLVCACEKGRFEDVKLLITGYNDVNGSNGNNNNMTLKEYVNQEGKDSYGDGSTPLMAAAIEEHFQIVKYLIEQCEADPNIADSIGRNALHLAALYNKKNTEVIEFLLTNMPLTSINKKEQYGRTPLDWAYNNKSPIKQKIIDLIRSKGGKRASEL